MILAYRRLQLKVTTQRYAYVVGNRSLMIASLINYHILGILVDARRFAISRPSPRTFQPRISQPSILLYHHNRSDSLSLTRPER